MDAGHADLIAKFAGVTGVDAERAEFYLQSSGWMLDVALSTFYDDDGGSNPEPQGSDPAAPEPEQPTAPSGRTGAPSGGSSRFATISNLHEDDDDDDEEAGQAFYAGGSERGGGQQVLGPPKKKQSADDFIQNMFKSAKDHGAETVEAGPSSGPPQKGRAFKGTGYRLGETEDSSAVVHGGRLDEPPQQTNVVLKLWQNGFSVGSGPLRDYRDPANKEFLESIHKGEIPRELIRLAKGGEVNMNMEDHRGEEFVQSKVKVQAFSGEGHMLGSPAPAAAAAGEGKPNESAAKSVVEVDSSQPTTNLQIRLADGSRMVAKFNHTHTVGDIRRYIVAGNPQYSSANFALMTTFPNKELTDESQTITSANLLNAVLVQRMK